jgi:hypothetical protein
LRAFRHVVNHRYGSDLKAPLVQENLERLRRALPLFTADLVRFAAEMNGD